MKKATAIITAVDLLLGMSACTTRQLEKRIEQTHTELTSMVEISSQNSNRCLGAFSLTFYTPRDDEWGYQTATGTRSQHLATCAVDPSVIPYGSVLMIEGDNGQILILKAVDCGGGIKGKKIDIFWERSTSEGYQWIKSFGTIHNVYLLEE